MDAEGSTREIIACPAVTDDGWAGQVPSRTAAKPRHPRRDGDGLERKALLAKPVFLPEPLYSLVEQLLRDFRVVLVRHALRRVAQEKTFQAGELRIIP